MKKMENAFSIFISDLGTRLTCLRANWSWLHWSETSFCTNVVTGYIISQILSQRGWQVIIGVGLDPIFAIEWLCLMSLAVKHLQRPLLCSVLFVRMQGKKLVSSTVILEMQATSKYYYGNCYCSAVTMPIKLSSYTTWSTIKWDHSFCSASIELRVILPYRSS